MYKKLFTLLLIALFTPNTYGVRVNRGSIPGSGKITARYKEILNKRPKKKDRKKAQEIIKKAQRKAAKSSRRQPKFGATLFAAPTEYEKVLVTRCYVACCLTCALSCCISNCCC